VRVFFYLEDRERTLDSPTDKIMLSLTVFADELEREKARQRTYDAMSRKARAGQVTGGRTFGYDNVRKDTGGVVRVINDAEAAIIREMFERCAKGQRFRVIARALNDAGAVCPRSQQGRPAGWCPSSVREALYRPLYRGEIVWNRTQKRNAWGVQQQHGRPASDWLRVDAPQLRIVPEPLWIAAHDRLSTSRETYLRTNRGTLWGKPTNGVESKYLLSGMSQCSVCGGLYVASRSHGRKRAYFYGCTTFHRKGASICTNNRLVALEDADWLVMEAVQDELLDPLVVAHALRVSLSHLTASHDGLGDRAAALRKRANAVAGEVARLTEAVATAGELAPLLAALRDRDHEHRRLQEGCDELEALARGGPVDADRVQADLAVRVTDWRTMAARNVAQGRQVLRKLLRGRVVLTPCEDGTCELSGQADYGKLFAGIVLQQRWRPQRDSTACSDRLTDGLARRDNICMPTHSRESRKCSVGGFSDISGRPRVFQISRDSLLRSMTSRRNPVNRSNTFASSPTRKSSFLRTIPTENAAEAAIRHRRAGVGSSGPGIASTVPITIGSHCLNVLAY
jgi:hypothetical protein